jgi:hypothetical protein
MYLPSFYLGILRFYGIPRTMNGGFLYPSAFSVAETTKLPKRFSNGIRIILRNPSVRSTCGRGERRGHRPGAPCWTWPGRGWTWSGWTPRRWTPSPLARTSAQTNSFLFNKNIQVIYGLESTYGSQRTNKHRLLFALVFVQNKCFSSESRHIAESGSRPRFSMIKFEQIHIWTLREIHAHLSGTQVI